MYLLQTKVQIKIFKFPINWLNYKITVVTNDPNYWWNPDTITVKIL